MKNNGNISFLMIVRLKEIILCIIMGFSIDKNVKRAFTICFKLLRIVYPFDPMILVQEIFGNKVNICTNILM